MQLGKFWNFTTTENGENELRIEGYIARESWFADEISPKQFKEELKQRTGDITVWVNSPGGECFAASEIYTALKEHAGKVTIKVDVLAGSAASVIAMAGDEVLMSPTAMIFIHNPAMLLEGEVADLEHGIEMLTELKESLLNAYQAKTHLSRAKLSKLMDAETWLNAKSAVKLGFADGLLYGDIDELEEMAFDRKEPAIAVANAFRKKLKPLNATKNGAEAAQGADLETLCHDGKELNTADSAIETQTGTSAESLYKRLSLLSH